MAFQPDEQRRQERLNFMSGNLTEKKSDYDKRGCCGNCSRKKICCLSCFACILAILLVIGGGALYFFCRPNPFNPEDAEKWGEMLSAGGNMDNISLDGTYTLVSYDATYETYLKSMGIPSYVVPLILVGSESLQIKVTDSGAEISTVTDWNKRDMKFEFNKEFNMTYGRGMGIMHNVCERPQYNVVFCRSEEREKDWNMTSHMVFSEKGLVNERIFINKNIGAKKYYQKEGAELEESFPVVTEKEIDIFADEDSEEWPEDW